MSEFVNVYKLSFLPEGGMKSLRVQGRYIGLFRVDGKVYATSDRCPHEGMPLATGGELEGHVITCGYHFWSFDVRTGRSTDGLEDCLGSYPVRIEGDDILVAVPEAPGGLPV